MFKGDYKKHLKVDLWVDSVLFDTSRKKMKIPCQSLWICEK